MKMNLEGKSALITGSTKGIVGKVNTTLQQKKRDE